MRMTTFAALLAGLMIAAPAIAGPKAAPQTAQVSAYTIVSEAITLPIENADREARLLEAMQMKPDFADAAYRLGDQYELTGQYDRAIEYFDKAMSLDPANRSYAERRANLYANMGRYSEGIARFTRDSATQTHLLGQVVFLNLEREHNDAALKAAQAYTQAAANDAEAHYWLGKSLNEMKRYDEAMSALLRSFELDSTSIKTAKEIQLVAMASNKIDQGIEFFTTQSAANPTNDQLLLFLSELHRADGNLAQAQLIAGKRADLLGPDRNVDAMNNVASMLEAGGSFEQALSKMFAAEKTGYASEFVHDRIKDIIFKMNLQDAAIDYFTNVVKTNPNPHTFRVLAECHTAKGDHSAAKYWLSLYVKAQPYKALGYSLLGTALAKTGSADSAIESFQKAAWYDLTIRDNFYRLRSMYVELNKLDAGIEFFNALVAYMPEKPELRSYLADLYEAKGERSAAATQLEALRNLRPATTALPELQSRLETLRSAR